MRFVSKSTNLLIVLEPGIPGNHLTGQTAKPTVSVRFKDGVVEVENEELVQKMLRHPGFNSDFIAVEGVNADPYKERREESEPIHEITTFKYGTPIKKDVKGGRVRLSPEVQAAATEMAKKMAAEMLPGMMKEFLEMAKESAKDLKEPSPVAPKAIKKVSTKGAHKPQKTEKQPEENVGEENVSDAEEQK